MSMGIYRPSGCSWWMARSSPFGRGTQRFPSARSRWMARRPATRAPRIYFFRRGRRSSPPRRGDPVRDQRLPNHGKIPSGQDLQGVTHHRVTFSLHFDRLSSKVAPLLHCGRWRDVPCPYFTAVIACFPYSPSLFRRNPPMSGPSTHPQQAPGLRGNA